jgi:hypothetical protein
LATASRSGSTDRQPTSPRSCRARPSPWCRRIDPRAGRR